MGFLDILGDIGGIIGGVQTLFGGASGSTGAAVQTTGMTQAQAAVAQLAASPADRAALLAGPAGQAVRADAAVVAAAGGVSGSAKVFTQTRIQRIDRATGNLLSEVIKMGSPFLMRSEVRALKRVTNSLRSANAKIPRRSAKVSQKQMQDAIFQDVQQLALINSLTHGGHHTNGS